MRKRVVLVAVSLLLVTGLAACGKNDSKQVASVGVDWTGNDITIESVQDPEVKGVVCHLAYFNRSLIDKLQQGNWFEDPSYSAIDCNAEGPVTVGHISLAAGGEEIFKEQRSLVWKSLRVNRVYDKDNNSLVYLAHVREVQLGSGKMSLSVVPLNGASVTWTYVAPAGVPAAASQ
ncbi:MAG: CreA family protein [Devosia sp.]|nr:CreA family protein [Devosia sp.]